MFLSTHRASVTLSQRVFPRKDLYLRVSSKRDLYPHTQPSSSLTTYEETGRNPGVVSICEFLCPGILLQSPGKRQQAVRHRTFNTLRTSRRDTGSTTAQRKEERFSTDRYNCNCLCILTERARDVLLHLSLGYIIT